MFCGVRNRTLGYVLLQENNQPWCGKSNCASSLSVSLASVFVVAVFGEEKFNFKIMTDPVDLMKFVQHLRDSNRKVSAAHGGVTSVQ